jgi:RiboL-PSP-HEPN
LTASAASVTHDDFKADLQRIAQLLGLIEDFRSFAATGDEYLKDAEVTEGARKLLKTADEVRTDLPLLSGSLFLYICGRFEYFVRELVGTIMDELVDKAQKYDDLPDALRKEHLNRTLAINLSPKKYNYSPVTAAALLGELAGSLSGTSENPKGFDVDSNVVTITESNMNSDTLAEIFERVGVAQIWDTLGKQSKLKAFLLVSGDADCSKVAKARLDEIMARRNRIAHPTKDLQFPDVDYAQDTSNFYEILSELLVDVAMVPR